jgi:N-acetylmuramoyl-L-alanine amidase
MALRRDWIPSPNKSGRSGGVRLIIIHTAEGALSYPALGSYFSNPNADVSSHTGIDDTPGVIGEYVSAGDTAWTAGNVNGYSVQTELCAFASWDAATWDRHEVMLQNCADWVREEADRFGIPLVFSTTHGVCGHVDVSGPGGHWDPGPAFPMDRVIAMASGARAPGPKKRKGRNMIAKTASQNGYWTATYDGGVNTFGDAQFKGAANDPDAGGPGKPHLQAGAEIVGIEGCGNDGYWLLASDGSVFSYGSAQFHGRPDRV